VGKYDIPTPSSSAERDVEVVVCLFPYLHIDQGFKFRQYLLYLRAYCQIFLLLITGDRRNSTDLLPLFASCILFVILLNLGRYAPIQVRPYHRKRFPYKKINFSRTLRCRQYTRQVASYIWQETDVKMERDQTFPESLRPRQPEPNHTSPRVHPPVGSPPPRPPY
jgi:hypothetical protein